MRNLIAKSFLYLALSLLLIHTFVPHFHLEDHFLSGSLDTNKKDIELFNWVRTMVSKDQGEGHLDYFSLETLESDKDIKTKSVEITDILAFNNLLQRISNSTTVKIFQFDFSSVFISVMYKSASGNRGPPTFYS